jgi:RHS repeat-associated protein
MGFKPWGELRFGASPTQYQYTGQYREPSLGIDFFNARWYDPALGRFLSADSIVPDPGYPGDFDRYAFVRNNPLRYVDPTGHWPDWLDNAIDFAQGATYQFVNDMTLGTLDRVATSLSLCMDCNRSDAYVQGQQAGRAASTVVSSTEAVLGAAAAAEGLAAMGPTAGGGLLCGAVTAGGCLVVAGVGLTAEGAMVVGGGAVAGHGVGTLAYIQNHHIATNKNSLWTPRFKELFAKGGLSFEDEANKLGLEGHLGRHTNTYHQWVYDRLEAAIAGFDNQADIAAALRSELSIIADELKANPGLLKGPR